MTVGSLFWLACGGLIVAMFAAIVAKVLSELSWHELKDYCLRRNQPERFDNIHDHEDDVTLSAEMLEIVACTLFLISVGGWQLTRNHGIANVEWLSLIGTVAVAAIVLMTATVWIPRAVALLWGPQFIFHTWRIWRTIARIFKPLSYGSAVMEEAFRRLDGRTEEPSEEEAFEEEIRAIVTEGQHDGLLEADAREMIEGVIELDDTDVADIMTSRSKIDAISVDAGWDEMLEFVVDCGRTRIPVFDKNLDDVVGILFVKDLLSEISVRPDSPRALRQILRTSWSVPKTIFLDELLQTFLNRREHMAMVVDEFMSVIGLVTIEDVLEEIVGEIIDESDKQELEEIYVLSDQLAEVDARTHVCDLNERLGTEIPEEQDFDTVGGFLLSELKRIPEDGETMSWNQLQITVLKASKRRIERLRIRTSETWKTSDSTQNGASDSQHQASA